MTRALTESYWPATHEDDVLDLTVGGMLARAAAEHPTRTALVEGTASLQGRRWTYAELLADADQCARALSARFAPGERVAVWAPNIPEWVILEFAIALAGLVLVTVNPAFLVGEVSYVLGKSRASGILLTREFRGNPMGATLDAAWPDLPDLREAIYLEEFDDFAAGASTGTSLPEVRAADPAQIQYTSGTTGFPKGALLHHRGLVNNARFTGRRANVPEHAVWFNTMPMFHTGGCVVNTLGAAAVQGTHVLQLAWDPALALDLIEQERVQATLLVPTMLIGLMDHPDFASRDLSSLSTVLAGGALVPADLVRRIEDTLGVTFSIVFGQTECSPVATQTAWDDTVEDKAQTIGRALPHTEVKIADPETHGVMPLGEVGEICVRGYCVMHEYYGQPDFTAAAIDDEGWLHTGDLGAMDARGYSTVEGRLKDMIIRGGENIYPKEIEDVLFAHPDVAEIAVVGVPDDKYGEQVAAFVRRSDGSEVTGAELTAHCREHLAAFKRPRAWVFVDSFPLTPSGKIQKFVLREQFAKGLVGPEAEPPAAL
jgi:fatty-acyl-CoA synthase